MKCVLCNHEHDDGCSCGCVAVTPKTFNKSVDIETNTDDIEATLTHTDTNIAEILERFDEEFKDDITDPDMKWALLWVKAIHMKDFIARECLALKKKWERSHRCLHTETDYTCPCWHDGYETGNAEPPLSEQKKWEQQDFENR